MTTKKKTQMNMRSTDRGGPLLLTMGIVLLAIGMGGLMSITVQTTTLAMQAVKQTLMGLAGRLYLFLPLLVLWLGGVLCVASKRNLSYRAVLLAMLFYLLASAFITLITFVPGYGSLMNYIAAMNMNRQLTYPDSMGAYFLSAFSQFDGRIVPVPGGGALGMILGYPIWRLFGVPGGMTLSVFLMMILGLYMLKINPVLLYRQFMERKTQGVERKKPVPAPAVSAKQADVEDEPISEDKQPKARRSVLPTNAPDEIPRKVAAVYTAEPVPIPSMEEPRPIEQNIPPFIPKQEAYQPVVDDSPFAQGFVQQETDIESFFYQTGVNYPVEEKKTTRQLEPKPVKRTEQAKAEPKADPGEEFKPPLVTREPLPWEDRNDGTSFDDEGFAEENQTLEAQFTPHPLVMERDIGARTIPAEERPERELPKASPRPVIKPVSTRVHEVTTDPAIPLTGERIPVQPTYKPLNPQSLDGTPVSAKPAFIEVQPVTGTRYLAPSRQLLSVPDERDQQDFTQEDEKRGEILIQTLKSFNIDAEMQHFIHGPSITRFAIRLAPGINVSRIRGVLDNLSVSLLAKSPVRAEIPIPGTENIGIEVSNSVSSTVYLSDVLYSSKALDNKSPTTVALGKDITGAPVLCDLMRMPHLLIAGATGSGKSVCINSIITSLLYRASPKDVRLILVDPKFVELQPYNGCPHLLLPVITEDKKVIAALEWLCEEMDERYRKMQAYNVRNIDGYNSRVEHEDEKMPKIIMIIDEMADLIATCGKAIEEHIKRITAKARAAGICLILATQRPSVNVITGVIKANIPSRIAFQVSSLVDSKTILDMVGAEKLLGYGDMLYMPRDLNAPLRVQGCFISDKEVETITDYTKSRNDANYNEELMDHLDNADKHKETSVGYEEDPLTAGSFDELLPQAIEMAVEAGQTSISMLQRVLRVGYGRAGRLIDEMDRRGIISANEGTKARKTLLSREEYNRMLESDPSKLF